MILAATPNPGLPNPGLLCELSTIGEVIGPGGDELDGAGLEVSVREGGGAMAAPPPEVAVERQNQLVGLK